MTFLLLMAMASCQLGTMTLALLPRSSRVGRQNIDMAITNCPAIIQPPAITVKSNASSEKLRAVVWVFWFLATWWWPIKVGQLKNSRLTKIWTRENQNGNSSHPNIAICLRWVIHSETPALWPGSKINLGANKVTHGGKPDAGMNGNAIIDSSSSLGLWEFWEVRLGDGKHILADRICCLAHLICNENSCFAEALQQKCVSRFGDKQQNPALLPLSEHLVCSSFHSHRGAWSNWLMPPLQKDVCNQTTPLGSLWKQLRCRLRAPKLLLLLTRVGSRGWEARIRSSRAAEEAAATAQWVATQELRSQ